MAPDHLFRPMIAVPDGEALLMVRNP